MPAKKTNKEKEKHYKASDPRGWNKKKLIEEIEAMRRRKEIDGEAIGNLVMQVSGLRDRNSELREKTQINKVRNEELLELVTDLRVALEMEYKMSDSLRACVAGSELASHGIGGERITVRHYLRQQVREVCDEKMLGKRTSHAGKEKD